MFCDGTIYLQLNFSVTFETQKLEIEYSPTDPPEITGK